MLLFALIEGLDSQLSTSLRTNELGEPLMRPNLGSSKGSGDPNWRLPQSPESFSQLRGTMPIRNGTSP